MQGYLAYILPVSGHPDNALPPGMPGHPSQGLPGWGGRPVDPSYGRPGWSPVDPGYGQGGWNRPDQGLPGYGHPSQGLPGQGGHPGNALPGGAPGTPDNTLPGGVHKGEIWIVAYHPNHGLKWVKVSDINSPDQTLPGTPPGGVAGQPLPETPAPKK